MPDNLNIVVLGLSITSSWGNGHATTYRSLVRALTELDHDVLFLERDVPWYADNRDLPKPPYGKTRLYTSLEELRDRFAPAVRRADLVIVGSYVPDGVLVGEWVNQTANGITAFYDIDTPVTLSKLSRRDYEYLSPDLIPQYDLYLSFTGGPTLRLLEQRYGAPNARPLYCSVDPEHYGPEDVDVDLDLGYLGTYSRDRQRKLESLLLQPARRWREGQFAVYGPQYPASIRWPANVQRADHLAPAEHRQFYNRQRYTLNVTRAAMVRAGYAPSIRLFEAAACGVPIISDYWPGLDEFFEIGREVLVAESADDTLRHLQKLSDRQRTAIGQRARGRVLQQHTAHHRALELERYVEEIAVQKVEQ